MAHNFIASSSERVTYSSVPADLPADWPLTIFCRSRTPNTTEQSIFGIHGTTNSFFIEIAKRVRTDGQRFQLTVNNSKLQGLTTYLVDTYYDVVGVIRSDIDRELYVDGVADGTATSSRTFPPVSTINIGVRNTSSLQQFYDGDIADCAIWDVELTLGEIQALSSGVSPNMIRRQNLIFYNPMWSASATSNLAESGNTGTVSGTPTVSTSSGSSGRYVPQIRYIIPPLAGGATVVIKTHNTDSILKKLDNSLVHNTDSVLKSLDNIILHDTDSILRKLDNIHTHNTDSIARKLDNLITHTTDSVLSEAGLAFVVHGTNSILKKLDNLTVHNTDSVLKDIDNIITHSTDSLLQSINTINHNTDSVFKQLNITASHTTDSLIGGLQFRISGITYSGDGTGTILGDVVCRLYKDNLDSTSTFIAEVISDSVTGVYEFTGLFDDDPQYFVVGWKDLNPNTYDVTDHILRPVL